jgi:hypothetical protein
VTPDWGRIAWGLCAFVGLFVAAPVLLGVLAGSVAYAVYRQKEAHIARLHAIMLAVGRIRRHHAKEEEAE